MAQRSANIDLLADVVRRTPSEVPYWNGETYTSRCSAWPFPLPLAGQPQKGLGQAFGYRYRYLDSTDLRTSVDLPILVELYANFGVDGVLFGSLFIGMIYRIAGRYGNRPGQTLLTSAGRLILLHPLLIQENDFALQFGGLFMYGVALYGLYRAICWRWGRARTADPRPAQDLPLPRSCTERGDDDAFSHCNGAPDRRRPVMLRLGEAYGAARAVAVKVNDSPSAVVARIRCSPTCGPSVHSLYADP